MADTNNLWIQITEESEEMDDATPVDMAEARNLIKRHNESETAHEDIRAQIQAVADTQTQEIKEYASKRNFPTSGDTSVTIYVDISTGNLYRYSVDSRQYEPLAMDTLPSSVALEGTPTAPTARTGTNTDQIATTQFVQNELAAIRQQTESVTPVYYDGRTKAKLSLLGDNGTIVTNVADGKVEQGSSDAITGGQLWRAQQDMSNMSALAARNIAANAAEIELLKRQNPLAELTDEVKDEFTSFIQVDDSDTVNAVASVDDSHNKHISLNVKTDGEVADGNTGLVTGDTVYHAIGSYYQPGIGIQITNGVIAVDDTIATKEFVERATKIRLINGEHTSVLSGEDDSGITFAVNVRANGLIQNGENRIVTGGTVFNETRLTQDGHYIRENDTAAQNIATLDQTLYNMSDRLENVPDFTDITEGLAELQNKSASMQEAITALQNQDEVFNETLLDKDLVTLTDPGKQVIEDIIRERSFRIINGDHTTATTGEEDGVPTYAINVRATGRIADNDGRIITGQTVYREVRPAQDGSVILQDAKTGENLTALDAAYSGLTDRVSALEEHDYVPGAYLSVSEQNELSVTVNGQVMQDNTGLVTGDQVADAIKSSADTLDTAIHNVHDELLERIHQIPDQDTQYVLEKDAETNQLVLKTNDGIEVSRIQLATDTDTKYSLEKNGNTIRLIPNNDPTQAIPIELDADLNTTYTLQLNEDNNLVFTSSDDTVPIVILLSDVYETKEAVAEALVIKANAADVYTKDDVDSIVSEINMPAGADIYNSASEFPESGEPNKLYIDAEKNSIYRWDEIDGNYKELQGNTINDCVTDISCVDGVFTITKADGSVITFDTSLTNEEIDTLFN